MFPTHSRPTSVPFAASIRSQSDASDFTACTCTLPSSPTSPTPRVFVEVSKVKSTSHSIVPSHVQTHTWLSTGVPTLVTSPEPPEAAIVTVPALHVPPVVNVIFDPSMSCTLPPLAESVTV